MRFLSLLSLLWIPIGLYAQRAVPMNLLDPAAMKRFVEDRHLSLDERCERAAQLHDAMILRRYFEASLEPAFKTPQDEEFEAQDGLSRDIMAASLACGLVQSQSITFSQKLLKRMKQQERRKAQINEGHDQ